MRLKALASALSTAGTTTLTALLLPLVVQAQTTTPAPATTTAKALFEALPVDQARFVVVSVPIGSSGTKAQLQIYEQIDPKRRPCFQITPGKPAKVAPLLGTFDFTGICRRYIDSQGYSARVGSEDLGSSFRFVVRKSAADMQLFAAPAGGKSTRPEMLVARTNGLGDPLAFLELKLEPGWRIMRRAFGGRALGHVYLYRDSWPAAAPAVAPANTPSAAPAAPVAPPCPRGTTC